ncbi:nucleoside deaminase [Azonexus sp.]|uniref:nucleoside deaminase n=1 Tax=Azonexus sp. TaxID=1872668 RepID=UPI0035B246BE
MQTSLYQQLAAPWREAVEQAWLASKAGSLPIGAVVVDREGCVVARGFNQRLARQPGGHPLAGSAVAHAEILALGSIKYHRPLQHLALYSTTEPCSMCHGAIWMAGIGELHFASRDPYLGATDSFAQLPFAARANCRVFGPESKALEQLLVVLLIERLLKLSGARFAIDSWRSVSEDVEPMARRLHARGLIDQLIAEDASCERMLRDLAQSLAAG